MPRPSRCGALRWSGLHGRSTAISTPDGTGWLGWAGQQPPNRLGRMTIANASHRRLIACPLSGVRTAPAVPPSRSRKDGPPAWDRSRAAVPSLRLTVAAPAR